MAKADYPAMLKFIGEAGTRGASPEDLLDRFYPPGIDRDTFLKDMSNFRKWAERERGVVAMSTNRYVLYDAEVARPYRRQAKVTTTPAST